MTVPAVYMCDGVVDQNRCSLNHIHLALADCHLQLTEVDFDLVAVVVVAAVSSCSAPPSVHMSDMHDHNVWSCPVL